MLRLVSWAHLLLNSGEVILNALYEYAQEQG